MTNAFFDRPILNSPYENPSRHWELDHGQPTQQIVEKRRPAEYIAPLPKPKKRKGQAEQASLLLDDDQGLSTQAQEYQKTAAIINAVRQEVGKWGTCCPRFELLESDGKSRLPVEANEPVTACNALMSSEAVARKRLKKKEG